MSIERGARLGPYTVAGLIGAGGMGEVHRATDARLKRDVALKTLPASVADDVARLDRLQREAELLASLNHPNIAHLYGIERGAGTTALVMELVEGPTLADRLARGALPQTEALEIALQIAGALEAAHERGIVHRDLKPANIKLTANGTVKVLDFGIAKVLEPRTDGGPSSQGGAAVTEVGAVLGTAPYMAPEQARGQAVDKRADIWSFGCVLYEMLAGKPAFQGDDHSTTLARVLERDPEFALLPASLAPAVRRTLELCLQKDSRRRARDIGDVRLALLGEFATPTAVERPWWRYALPAAVIVAGAIVAGAYIVDTARTPTAALAPPPPAAITRFAFATPPTAPLASLSGYDLAVSPDGRRFVYFAENSQTGSIQLYLRDLDDLEARPLDSEMPPGNGALNPFFSPDGRSLLLGRSDGGLHRVFIDGAPAMRIADHRGGMVGGAWLSEDTIVYSAAAVLQRVPARGGAPQPLVPGREIRGISPAVLPGASAVLFAVPRAGGEDIHVLDLDTGEQKELVPGGQNPTYLATGHLVFVRDGTLMAAPFDAAERALTGDPVALLRVRAPGAGNAADYALSASGTLVYVPGTNESAELRAGVWVDRRGEIVGRATDVAPFARDPRLAPDGRRLVLTTGVTGDGDLWIYDLTGRPPLRVATAGNIRRGAWSPDGRRIVFDTAGPDGNLFSIASDGSMLAPVPLRAERLINAVPTDWSRAGELLLQRFTSGQMDIAVIAIEGENGVRDVVATEYLEFDATWSPNGRWLAYASSRSGQNEIWVQAFPDGVPVRVSPNSGFEPRWSADGRELFYLRGATMMAATVETEGEFSFSTPERLFDGQFAIFPAPVSASYDVARDGRFLMLEPQTDGGAARPPADIVVVENFAEEVARRVPARTAR